jgi:hypothetical protein
MSISYIIKIEEFAQNHYINFFSKKYKNFWDVTIKSIVLELEHFNEFIKTDHIDLISCCGSITAFKSDFRVAGFG